MIPLSIYNNPVELKLALLFDTQIQISDNTCIVFLVAGSADFLFLNLCCISFKKCRWQALVNSLDLLSEDK